MIIVFFIKIHISNIRLYGRKVNLITKEKNDGTYGTDSNLEFAAGSIFME